MSPSISIIGLLIILVLLVLIAAGVTLIILGLTGRKARGGDGAVCGKCGYSVKGLTALSCPECGSDLREVGIERPGGAAGRNVALVCGIVLLGLVFMCVVTTLFWGMQVRTPMPVHTMPSQPAPAPPMPPAQP